MTLAKFDQFNILINALIKLTLQKKKEKNVELLKMSIGGKC